MTLNSVTLKWWKKVRSCVPVALYASLTCHMKAGLVNIDGPNPRSKIRRTTSRAFLSEDGMPQPIEYYLASDPSAIIEHTKRVLYLEDDDIAHIADGGKSMHHKVHVNEIQYTIILISYAPYDRITYPSLAP